MPNNETGVITWLLLKSLKYSALAIFFFFYKPRSIYSSLVILLFKYTFRVLNSLGRYSVLTVLLWVELCAPTPANFYFEVFTSGNLESDLTWKKGH